MRSLKITILAIVLVMITGTGFGLNWLRSRQKLGKPAILSTPIKGSVCVKIDLPENVLDFTSTNVPTSDVVLGYLPKDTSYAQRFYQGKDGFWANANIILMGTDRSSIHKADYCLAGQGLETVKKETVNIRIAAPFPYELPIAKWTVRRVEKLADGSTRESRALYAFWFVAEGEQTVSNDRRILWFYRDLLTRGVVQRWAYVSYLCPCPEGQEDAAFERIKSLIAASVPEFQLPPNSVQATAVAQH
jgi:hypothetical protein